MNIPVDHQSIATQDGLHLDQGETAQSRIDAILGPGVAMPDTKHEVTDAMVEAALEVVFGEYEWRRPWRGGNAGEAEREMREEMRAALAAALAVKVAR